MEVQQTNHLKSSSHIQTKLIDDQENPSVGSSFDKKKDSSDIHQRSLNSEQEAVNSGPLTRGNPQGSHQGQTGSQPGDLSPSFERFYKAMTMMSIFISTGALLWSLFTFTFETNPTPWYMFDFSIVFCSVIQSVYAYQGFMKKDSKEMKTSLITANVIMFLMGSFLVAKLVFALSKNEAKETSLDYGFFISRVLMMGLYALLIYFPTRKVSNAFELIPQDDQKRMRELVNSLPVEQLQGFLLLEKLNATSLILFKYGHLAAVCLGVKWLLSGIFGDLSPEEENLKKTMSEWSFFVLTIKGYFLIVLLFILISFFVFEGIRGKNLKKIETSTKLIKIFLVGWFLLSILEGVALDNGRIVWRHEKSVIQFGQEQGNMALGFFLIFYFGAFKAQTILRDHERSKRSC